MAKCEYYKDGMCKFRNELIKPGTDRRNTCNYHYNLCEYHPINKYTTGKEQVGLQRNATNMANKSKQRDAKGFLIWVVIFIAIVVYFTYFK